MSILFMLFPCLGWLSWNSRCSIHGLVCTESQIFHIRVLFIGVWSFLCQALADGVGKCWDWEGLLGEENMLV